MTRTYFNLQRLAGWVVSRRNLVSATVLAAGLSATSSGQGQERALGLDISYYQGNISQTTWNNLRNVDNRQFVVLRSSRGGTTGYYNQSDPNNTSGANTLSQRYDDPYYIQNINRATTAGMFAGSYHFSRPDVIETTLNSGGIANSGTDEADHFIQMAGPWMRPGFLVPMHDLEAGDGKRTDNEMAQFCIDFSTRIYEVMGIRPGIYINGNYAAFVLGGATQTLRDQLAKPAANLPSVVSPSYSILWSARWPNQSDPNSIDVQNTNPKDTYSAIYGPWDDYGEVHPWKFWQYASTAHLPSYSTTANLDVDVVNGGVEFLKDCLVPAVWMDDSSGDWSTLSSWNSGQTPTAPVQGSGQMARVGTLTLPTPRLPGAAGSGTTSGQHDTVILERPNANITVTLSTGAHNIRKLYMREAMNITGGSLNINYVPSVDSTTNGAQFSGPVSLTGGSLSVHTLQVDTTRTFTLGGGTLAFDTINLMPHSSTPAKILINGNVTLNPLANALGVIAKGTGASTSGSIDLGGGNRLLTVGNGTSDIDLSIDVPVSNGGFTKAGAGTLRLSLANSYAGGTTVSAGTLLLNAASGSATGSGAIAVNGGVLGGVGTIAGAVTVNSGGTISPGASIGTLTLSTTPTLNGTTFMEINRNGGSPQADKLVLSSGTLTYGGTLAVTNLGAALAGGDTFTLFAANAYSGSFAATNLPPLNSGMNWYLGALNSNGSIKVNRKPTATLLTVTNNPAEVLKIPIATLLASGADVDGDTLALASFDSSSTNGITLATNGTFVTYSNDKSVADRFNYTIEDGRGGSVTGTVQIVPSAAGRFAGQSMGSGNSVMLHFSGLPGWTYYAERSTNLPVWLTIGTNVAPANGLFDFTDDFHDLSQRPAASFYRLRWSE